MLNQWIKDNKIEYREVAKQIGITYQGLHDIIKNKSPETKVRTCMAIRKLTGLEPEQYLNGLKDYVEIKNRK